ncbi:FeoA family protein [Alkalinema pantanalense CENA528]|uniref:FeoA family protein n=1 Tax=Alkalinema pantanalense TaxID=1620705 RepID=UPI003D6F0726
MNSDDLVSHWTADRQADRWQEFVYVSDAVIEPSSQTSLPPDGAENSLNARVFPLSVMQVGDRVRIVSLNCGDSNNRLMGMGLIPGAVLEVMSSRATGSVIVSLQDHRLGLGAEMAERIQVIDADQPVEIPQAIPAATIEPMQTTPDSSPVKLRDAAIGSVLRVIGYEPTARDYKRKLLAMGLTPGTELRVMRHAPLGDPTEIEVRDFHLSLRKDEADALIVTPITGEAS